MSNNKAKERTRQKQKLKRRVGIKLKLEEHPFLNKAKLHKRHDLTEPTEEKKYFLLKRDLFVTIHGRRFEVGAFGNSEKVEGR